MYNPKVLPALAMAADVSDYKLSVLTHDQLRNLVKDIRGMAQGAIEHVPTDIVFETGDTLVQLRQFKNKQFRVTYGQDTRDDLGYRDAAHNLGYCLMHALACAGRIDNEGK